MKILIIIILFYSAYSQSNSQNLNYDSLVTANNELKSELLNTMLKLEESEIKQNQEKKSTEKVLNQIISLVSTANYIIAVLGIFIAVGGILLTWYINKVANKMNSSLKEANNIEKKVIELNEMIQEHPKKLYKKIKKEELLEYSIRLSRSPQDISNILTLLLVVELEEIHFNYIKKGFLNIEIHAKHLHENEPHFIDGYKEKYALLFFQHFLGLSLSDEKIKKEIQKRLNYLMICSYDIDMYKSTKDMAEVITAIGIEKHIDFLISFITNIGLTGHDGDNRIYEILFNSLEGISNRFTVLKALDDGGNVHATDIWFQFIEKEYSNTNLNKIEYGLYKKQTDKKALKSTK